MATLEDTFAQIESLQKADLERFEALAREAADGQAVDPEELRRVMLSTGKDVAEFRNLVGVFNRRAELRQDIAFAEDAEKRVPKLQAEIEKHNEVLERAVAAHQEKCRPIQAEIRTLNDAINARADARHELVRSCPSAELKRKHDEASRQIQQISQEIDERTRTLGQIETEAAAHPETDYSHRLKSIRERIATLEESRRQAKADVDAALEEMRNY